MLDVPTGYDTNKPYRLIFVWHPLGGSGSQIVNGGYNGLKSLANNTAVFATADGLNGSNSEASGTGWWNANGGDMKLVQAMLDKINAGLCIDQERIFSTGFSFGGMITYSLSTNHQKTIRAAVGIAPANYNIWLPNPLPHDPIAWMSTTGMSDGTCPWGAGKTQGAEAIAKMRGTDNGCTVPATVPTTTAGSKTHLCYDFQGCKSNYPVKACTFDGGHIATATDGQTGDDGLKTWIPTESWKFFTQF
jgi:poly(3-hydroxybutyrate) depolymerase